MTKVLFALHLPPNRKKHQLTIHNTLYVIHNTLCVIQTRYGYVTPLDRENFVKSFFKSTLPKFDVLNLKSCKRTTVQR